MLRTPKLCLLVPALALAVSACERPEPAPAEDTGRVILSIMNAPPDALCLRITAKGATTAIRSFGLMTGASMTFPLEGLPVGMVQFTAEAFPVSCGVVDVMSVASYVSDLVNVTLLDGVVVNVALALHRPGRANVSVDFPGMGSPIGAPCMSAGQCASGFCADGVCCSSACGGTCMACNQPGAVGSCAALPAGQDPASECPADPVSSCGRDGVCNGAGACRLYTAGTQCSPASCTGSTQMSAGTCSGTGMCVPGASLSCGPYVCNGIGCATSCTSNAGCSAGNVCLNGMCVASNSCNPACQPGFICQAGMCVPSNSCTSNAQCPMGLICLNGMCVASNSCNPACQPGFICQAGMCVPSNSCTSNAQCPMGLVCLNGMCVPAGSCNPACQPGFVCQNSMCVPAGSCTSNAQCPMGLVCQNGMCVPAGSCNPACQPGFVCQNSMCVPASGGGPALLWRFDETSGTVAVDSSVNHFDGLYVGGPASSTLVPPSASNDPRSRAFVRANQQAVQLAATPAALKPANNLTLSAWFRATSIDTSGAEIISAGDNYVLRLRPTQVEFAKRVTVNGAGTYVQCFGSVSTHLNGAWHHLAGVSTTAGMTLYFDGMQVCTNASGQDLRYDRGPDFWVGRHGNGSTAWDFEGNIDDVRVYGRALTAAEIAGLAPGSP
jgi:hypothetical protein